MTATELAVLLIGSACYAVSTVVGIRLRDQLTVPIAAALGPPVAIVALRAGRPAAVLLVAPLLACMILVLAKRSSLEAISHSVLFLLSALCVLLLGAPGAGSIRSLIASCAAAGIYALGEVIRQSVMFPGGAHSAEDRQTWFLLQAVLICSAGLMTLIVDRMGWPAFVAMAAVLALTRREFEGFALSRNALEQAIDALDRLAGSPER